MGISLVTDSNMGATAHPIRVLMYVNFLKQTYKKRHVVLTGSKKGS